MGQPLLSLGVSIRGSRWAGVQSRVLGSKRRGDVDCGPAIMRRGLDKHCEAWIAALCGPRERWKYWPDLSV